MEDRPLNPMSLNGEECPASPSGEAHAWGPREIGDSVDPKCGTQVSRNLTAQDVEAHYAVEDLTRPPITVARAAPEIPSKSGLYAWFADEPLVPGHEPRLPEEDDWHLLYVGIAPARQSSKATLRSRILKQHLGGNVGASTFRLSLAAMLWEEEGWQPTSAGSRVRLTKSDNAELSRWQERHLALRWTMHPSPRSIEPLVIEGMGPPLNIEASIPGSTLNRVKAARDRFRHAARS